MRIHSGDRPYKCTLEDCNKEFKAYGHLSDHIKRHLNFKPFKCEQCGSCFSRSNALKTHMMTHSGERPYVCPYPCCGKRFTEKGNMKTHTKIHVNLLIYLYLD